MFTDAMNPLELSVQQLKRAAAIKEQIEALNKELRGLLGFSGNSGLAVRKKPGMSAAVKRKIAAAQRARWASIKAGRSAATSAKRSANAKK
jgi:hypothetical protein